MFFLRIFLVFLLSVACVAPSDAFEIPLQKEGGVYTLPVRINDAITLNFIVDSGAAEVAIPADVVSTLLRMKAIKDSDFLPGQVFTLADGSKLKSPRFLIRELELGGVKVRNVTGCVTKASGDLLLGQSLLEKFSSWKLDNKTHALVLERGKETSPAYAKNDERYPVTNNISMPPEQGTYIEFTSTAKGMKERLDGTVIGRVYDKGAYKRFEVEGFRAVITDYNKSMVYILFLNERSYQQGTLQEFQDNVLGLKAGKIVITPTEETKVINGYNCKKVTNDAPGSKSEIWVSPEVVGYDKAASKSLREFRLGLIQNNPSLAPMCDLMRQVPYEGVAVQETLHYKAGGTEERTLKQYDHRSIDDSIFTVPKDFRFKEVKQK